MAALLDTHIWAWTLTLEPLLSSAAQEALDYQDGLAVSAVTLYEIAQKVRLGKWAVMAPHVHALPELARFSDMGILPVTDEIALMASLLDWTHKDPFDRILAATALYHDLPLISADLAFDNVPGLRRIW